MIRIEQISKRFRRLQVLRDINASLEKGQVVSLIGPNGSGKTTLIKCILGMIRPDEGTIHVNGQLINGDPSYRRWLGYMPQIGRYPDNMRMGQLFDMLKNIRGAGSALDESLVQDFGLERMFDKPMRTLSGGTRQKVSAALAFLFDPPVLILDEPTAGLDPLSSEIVKQKILEQHGQGKLVLITSHILSDLDELTSHVMYLQEGKLQFFKDLGTLQEDTGELKLGKAIARVMKGEEMDENWMERVFFRAGDEKVF